MKIHLLLTLAVFCTGLLTTSAADNHSHRATPKGGRLLEKTEPHAEFVVENDRTVTINFYDHDLKSVAVTTQTVTVIANAKEKATLEFERKGNSLVSKSKLPEGDGYQVVVQFRQTPEARPMNFRFKLELHTCGGCQRQEYACTCGH